MGDHVTGEVCQPEECIGYDCEFSQCTISDDGARDRGGNQGVVEAE
jgi:hypothetical protein